MNSALIHHSALEDPDSQEYIVAFLYDAQVSCFIQKGDVTVNLVRSKFTSAAQKDKAVRLLERLKKRNRFLNCSSIDRECSVSGPHYCEMEFLTAAVVLAGRTYCQQNSRCSECRAWLTDERRTQLLRYDYTRLHLASAADWEEQIIKPILRFGRKLSLIDYKAGDNFLGYASSLIWLRDLFLKHGRPEGAAPIEVLTAFPSRATEREAVAWGKSHGFDIIARGYNPNIDRSLPHDRYLITDGIGLMIGRGFNLQSGERIRESAIFIVEDPASVLNKAHSALFPSYR